MNDEHAEVKTKKFDKDDNLRTQPFIDLQL